MTVSVCDSDYQAWVAVYDGYTCLPAGELACTGAQRLWMDAFQSQALQMILSPDVKKAFDLSSESEKTKEDDES